LLLKLNTLQDRHQLPKAASVLRKFQQQIPAFAVGVNTWWRWVQHTLSLEDLDTPLTNWLLGQMLPKVYWQLQLNKTKSRSLKRIYQRAQQQAHRDLLNHAFTATLADGQLQHWQEWAKCMVSRFHRASSAVEGRNGYLSQRHHAQRGFWSNHLPVLTVIHNFDLKRSDGTTAAQRLFGRQFPNLFAWVLEQMGALPRPRVSKKSVKAKTLTLQSVPLLIGSLSVPQCLSDMVKTRLFESQCPAVVIRLFGIDLQKILYLLSLLDRWRNFCF